MSTNHLRRHSSALSVITSQAELDAHFSRAIPDSSHAARRCAVFLDLHQVNLHPDHWEIQQHETSPPFWQRAELARLRCASEHRLKAMILEARHQVEAVCEASRQAPRDPKRDVLGLGENTGPKAALSRLLCDEDAREWHTPFFHHFLLPLMSRLLQLPSFAPTSTRRAKREPSSPKLASTPTSVAGNGFSSL